MRNLEAALNSIMKDGKMYAISGYWTETMRNAFRAYHDEQGQPQWDIRVSEDVPLGEIHFHSPRTGKVVGKIIDIATEPAQDMKLDADTFYCPRCNSADTEAVCLCCGGTWPDKMPNPKPAPAQDMKLEAGCEVVSEVRNEAMLVLGVDGDVAWVKEEGPFYRSIPVDLLTVTTAAVPEVGDLVEDCDTRRPTLCGRRMVIIDYTEPIGDQDGIALGSQQTFAEVEGHRGWISSMLRQKFTIILKGKGDRERERETQESRKP